LFGFLEINKGNYNSYISLKGSLENVEKSRERGENIKFIMNLDMIAYSKTKPLLIELITKLNQDKIDEIFQQNSERFSTVEIKYGTGFNHNNLDSSNFLKYYPAVTMIAHDSNGYPYTDTINDTSNKLNIEIAHQILRISLASFAEIIGFE